MSYKTEDFQVGTNSNAGELPEELAVIMRRNSEALEEMRQNWASRSARVCPLAETRVR